MFLRHSTTRRTRRALIGATYLAFACRLAIPAGYMPSAWGEGGPVSLCPMGLPAGLLLEQPGHHHHDEEPSGVDILWEYCPLGALTDTASVVPDVQFQVPFIGHARPVEIEPAEPSLVATLAYRPRGPPHLTT